MKVNIIIAEVIKIGRLSEILPMDMHFLLNNKEIEEIRFCVNSYPYVKSVNDFFFTDRIITASQFDQILLRICNNSYHTHSLTINKGYINAGEGIRVGVCGRAILKNETVYNVDSIESLCIRIPHLIRNVSQDLFSSIIKTDGVPNILFYSPPGVGKTTLLRDIIIRLMSKPYYKKISLLDSREEVYISQMGKSSLLNVYRGYPKEYAFEASIRTMAPDVIVTDEIASEYESDQIHKYLNSGVTVIATTHASGFDDLIHRPFIQKLYENKCFDVYCGIKRKASSKKFDFEITIERKEYQC